LVEFFAGSSWSDPAGDDERMTRARAWGGAMQPFASGTYVNVLSDADSRTEEAHRADVLARLAAVKRRYDPENVFHLNQNIRPAPD
jgi:FAD/FMN-containing dehydrogenase